MAGSGGKLEKLEIIAYENENYSGQGTGSCKVAINPEKYSLKYQIEYNKTQAPGEAGASPKFNTVPGSEVNFELVFDSTGAIPAPKTGADEGVLKGSVEDQIKKFKEIVFSYSGKIHSPNFLALSWGNLVFHCRMTSLDINYTLFKPDGSPLRAKANVAFIGFESEKKLAAKADNSSPDLTHLVTVEQGETLPLLCYRVYKESSFYLEVARVNNLLDFRILKPGQTLLFPPVKID